MSYERLVNQSRYMDYISSDDYFFLYEGMIESKLNPGYKYHRISVRHSWWISHTLIISLGTTEFQLNRNGSDFWIFGSLRAHQLITSERDHFCYIPRTFTSLGAKFQLNQNGSDCSTYFLSSPHTKRNNRLNLYNPYIYFGLPDARMTCQWGEPSIDSLYRGMQYPPPPC